MSNLFKAATLSADLVRYRNEIRRQLGPAYEPQVKDVRVILRSVSKERKKSLSETALELADEMDKAGHDPSLIFAALVDECEAQN